MANHAFVENGAAWTVIGGNGKVSAKADVPFRLSPLEVPDMATDLPVDLHRAEQFTSLLRKRPLPRGFVLDPSRRRHFEHSVLASVEGLYRDRIAPTLGELQGRLRSETLTYVGEWSMLEIRGILAVCARDDRYIIVPPNNKKQPEVRFRVPPAWFVGWVNIDEPDQQEGSLQNVWGALNRLLGQKLVKGVRVKTGVKKAASGVLRHPRLQSAVGHLCLGEARQLVARALAVGSHGALTYDPVNGRRLVLRRSDHVEFSEDTRPPPPPFAPPAPPLKFESHDQGRKLALVEATTRAPLSEATAPEAVTAAKISINSLVEKSSVFGDVSKSSPNVGVEFAAFAILSGLVDVSPESLYEAFVWSNHQDSLSYMGAVGAAGIAPSFESEEMLPPSPFTLDPILDGLWSPFQFPHELSQLVQQTAFEQYRLQQEEFMGVFSHPVPLSS